MYPILDGIRKIARYTPQAWGGTMAEAGKPQGGMNPLSMAGSFIVPSKATSIASKGVGGVVGRASGAAAGEAAAKAFKGKAMYPAYAAYDFAQRPFRAVKDARHASRYGSRLGASNPYLAGSL